ncbi:transcription factor HES-2 [Nematostella vectensis]|uniref:transcription factor HES-2 n=1 Tax=Nematostella vectensis TaxID=45351 RepID=UPI002077693C|nr:transcription factor HES-2 [Nematostella vectensis]
MADKSFDKVLKNRQCKLANKSSKPLLERQRRARINHSLNELKTLVLSSLYQNCPQAEQNCEKMEKAEILELTVNFLKVIQSRRNTVMPRPDLEKANEFHHVKMEQMSPEQANARQHPVCSTSQLSKPLCCQGCRPGQRVCEPYVVAAPPSMYSLANTRKLPVAVNPHHVPEYQLASSHVEKSSQAQRSAIYTHVSAPSKVWRPW